jgi:hypothetical protein
MLGNYTTTTNKYEELEKKFDGNFRETSMLDSDYKDSKHPVFWLEFYGAHCPICGNTHWCMINVTGTKVICQRTSNDHPFPKTNGYLYYLDDSYKVCFDASKQRALNVHPKADPLVLDLFYRAVLQCYSLSDKHRANLHRRGLTDEMINLHGERGFGTYYNGFTNKDGVFKSYFTQAKLERTTQKDHFKVISLWKNFIENLYNTTHDPKFKNENYWFGVPGFYNETYPINGKNYKLPCFSASDGMLVPFYNEDNELIAFQTRVDHVKKSAEIIKPLKKNPLKLDVMILDNDEYIAKVYRKHDITGEIIAKGNVNGQNIITNTYGIDVMKEEYSFKVNQSQKYFWVSSAKKEDGAGSKSPVCVAYNPEITALNPTAVDEKTGEREELKKIRAYAARPKAIWVTEGSLKAQVAVNYLGKRFDQNTLNRVGRDFLAVGGVSMYKHFLPMLKKLNVISVTTAYDMDFQTNTQVKKNYRKLIEMLKQNGFKIRFANWDLSQAKGIDDALVKGVDIDFREI